MTGATEPHIGEFVSDDIPLRYLDWGAGAGTPLVLLHGIRDQAHAWDAVARALAAGRRVVAPDLRGHGDSGWSPDGAYLLPYHVVDLIALMEALGPGQVDLVGHSFGGGVASRYAALFPERVRRLVLVDGFGPSAEHRAQWAAEGAVVRTRDWLARRHAAATRPARPLATIEDGMARLAKGNPRLGDDQARHLAMHGLRAIDGGFAWKFDPRVGIFAPEDFATPITDYWRGITAPALLCYGAESWSALGPDDERLAALPHAEIEAIPDAGHWPHHDQPERFVAMIERFLG